MENKLWYINKLETDNAFFDEEFLKLNDEFTISNDDEVRGFLKQHPGIFVLLDEVKPYLSEYFADGEYEIYISYDPEIVNFTKLVLLVRVNREHFHNGARIAIKNIRNELRPIRQKTNIYSEFLIMPGVLNV